MPAGIMGSVPPAGEANRFLEPESISWAGRLSIYLTLLIMAVAFVMRSIARY